MVESYKSFKCLDCGAEITGTNCAYSLSRKYQIKGPINEKHHWCKCRYPIRAKELRKFYFKDLVTNFDKDENYFIYCENLNGNGHVYFGTEDKCVEGNGYTASKMKPLKTIERYKRFVQI